MSRRLTALPVVAALVTLGFVLAPARAVAAPPTEFTFTQEVLPDQGQWPPTEWLTPPDRYEWWECFLGYVTDDAVRYHSRGRVLVTWVESTDPRFSGALTATLDETIQCTTWSGHVSGTFTLVDAGGSWSGTVTCRLVGGDHLCSAVAQGEGAYAGLHAKVETEGYDSFIGTGTIHAEGPK